MTLSLSTSATAQPSDSSGLSEDEKAAALFERAFSELLDRSPQFQTRLGIKDGYDRWDNISEAYTAQTHAIVERQLGEVRDSIDPAKLSEDNRLSYELFVSEWQSRLDAHQWRDHDYPFNQMFGLQSVIPSFLINYHRVESIQDAEAYIARLEGVSELMQQGIDGMKRRAARGVLPPKFVFAYVLEDSRNVISGAPFDKSGEDCAILEDFRNKISGVAVLSDGDKEIMTRRAIRALLVHVGPAYQELIRYITELEKTATSDDGAWKLPDGAAYYKYRLREITTTNMSADAIHQLGLGEVARIHGEMRDIMKSVGYEGSLKEFFEFMRSDERFYYEDTEEGRQAYLEEAKRIIDNMRNRLDELFIVKPEADMIVKAVEPFREKSAGKAFYQRPSPDGSRPGVYYANLYRMSDMPTYQMEALAYHEGIPGHHMQLAIAMELENTPTFRKYARYTAYTEGWALYTELLPREIGLYEDPYSDFGRLAMELWRACRLVVDTGIHDKKWTREQAIDYLVENTPNPYGDAVKAIERYIVMPGQATAYKIGMIRIIELRERARDALGDRFDIREFHDVVLKNGPVPLDVLERLVDEWVRDRQG